MSPICTRSIRTSSGLTSTTGELEKAATALASEPLLGYKPVAVVCPNPGERLAIICAVMVVFAFTSNFTYALVGSLLRQFLAQGRRLLWFNRLMALVLVATAAWMVGV